MSSTYRATWWPPRSLLRGCGRWSGPVLEDLEVEAEAAPVEPDLRDDRAGVDVEVVEHPVVVVPHLRQRVDEVAAQHAGEEGVGLFHVGHGDADVVAAAQSGDADAHGSSSANYVSTIARSNGPRGDFRYISR